MKMTDIINEMIDKELKIMKICLNKSMEKEINRFKTNIQYKLNKIFFNTKLIPNFKLDFLKMEYRWFRFAKTIEFKLKYKEVDLKKWKIKQ
jgi:hypothetical protein